SGGVAWRFISPCVRNTGGSPTRRCRSEEADCTSFLSSSPRARSAPLYCVTPKSPGRPADEVVAGAVAGVSTMGAAAMAEGFGGRGGGAADGGAPDTAGARGAAGTGAPGPAAGWAASGPALAQVSDRLTTAHEPPISARDPPRTTPRS